MDTLLKPSQCNKVLTNCCQNSLPLKHQILFSLPEPNALGELIGKTMVCRQRCMHHRLQHFQMTSPLKPLCRLKSNYMWSLHGVVEQKFVCKVWFTWPRWPSCPYLVKTFEALLLGNWMADDFEIWYAALVAWALSSRKHAYIILTPLNPTFIK